MVDALVAGHICLDIIPELHAGVVFEPGRLVEAGPATLSTGGAVSNTGLALSKLGVETRLLGKVGTMLFGRTVREILDRYGPNLGDSMVQVQDETTSYTIVVTLPGQDRMFLHSPGCNNTFVADDVSDEVLANTRLMHFGYPPLMARMFADDGEELVKLFRRAKEHGVTTSLDMSLPDANAPSGQADWRLILRRVLPYVDVFVPSIEELLFMLERPTFETIRGAVYSTLPTSMYARLAEKSLALGAKMVGIKAGSRGLYLRVGTSLEGMGRAAPSDAAMWTRRELWAPCFKVQLAGTTGAGDATIGGFLMGLLRNLSPEAALTAGVAAGACCCEEPDAVNGVRTWDETRARIEAGWERLPLEPGDDWERHACGVYERGRK